MFSLRKRKLLAIQPVVKVRLLSPAIFEVIVGTRTRLTPFVWYRAICEVFNDREITVNRLSVLCGVSHQTAKKMKKRILERIN